VLGGVNGTITFAVPYGVMDTLNGMGVFQLDIIYSSGVRWRHSEGKFKTYKDTVR
jgi:hypothetical protein